MKKIQLMKDAAEKGLRLCDWLPQDVMATVRVDEHGAVKEATDQIRHQYMSRIIPGLDDRAEYCYLMLYRVQSKDWLNDAIINALCERISQDDPSVRYIGTPDARPGRARTNRQSLWKSLVDKILALIVEDSVKTLLLPVIFGNSNWCGILVDIPEKIVEYYGSLDQDHYVATLKALALLLNLTFKVKQVETPRQFDSYNYGVFMCFFFYNHVNPSAAVDKSPPVVD